MKTITEDPQLEDELQELYILSKHWISDIHFEEDEIRFLKKIINNYLVPGLDTERLAKIESFYKILAHQEANIADLKIKIGELLKFMEPLINETNREIGLDLLEKCAILEAEMKTLFETVKQAKRSLFLFTEDIMKAACKCSCKPLVADA